MDRPRRSSMEGMIWNGNLVLDRVSTLKTTQQISEKLFQYCQGICLISVVHIDRVFSGNLGTGVFLKKLKDGSWSNPLACCLTGVDWRFPADISVEELIVFILDSESGELLANEESDLMLRCSIVPASDAFAESLLQQGNDLANAVAYGISKDSCVCLNMDGASLGVRHAVNRQFYSSDMTSQSIMNRVTTYSNLERNQQLDNLYIKLNKISAVLTEVSSVEADGEAPESAPSLTSSGDEPPEQKILVLDDGLEDAGALGETSVST